MNVLIISAHMDDEVLGTGGVIGKHVAAKDKVTVCIVCMRAYNHQFDPEAVAEEKSCAVEAARILGYEDIRFLDLRDELLDERLLDVLIPLEDCVQDVKPSVVYTHHRGDTNQDHRAVFRASIIACRALSQHKVARILSYEVPSATDIAPPFAEFAFQPNFYVNIAGFLDRKIEALKAYRRELREFPHPRSSKGIEVIAAKRGMEIGFVAAEAFTLMRDEWS
jgi:N-acetylglucosamine malate deacetylase 1